MLRFLVKLATAKFSEVTITAELCIALSYRAQSSGKTKIIIPKNEALLLNALKCVF